MRDGLRVLTVVLLAGGIAACDGGDQVETFEGEEAATPELEAPGTTSPGMDNPVLTARLEAPEDAPETNQVTGLVRIYAAQGGAADRTATPGTTAETPETTGAGETGAAAGQGFRLDLTADGLSQGEHAWHIHAGPCGEQAPVIVAFSPTSELEGIAEALRADQSGHVQSTATVPSDKLSLDQLRSGAYSLHIHQQGGVDHGPTVACADLEDEGDVSL